ncbi:MAG: hypothetical protein JST40_00715 [Armatimonadetes bacterium]|nr:hypothetical protein [Armatimonadota bacterium]
MEIAKGLEATPKNLEAVAARTSPEAARWAFTQWRLRDRAKAKFDWALDGLFVDEALQQASHQAIARYHASLFPTGVPVADLTCGIGGDLRELSARGPAIGFDLDAERLSYADHNCRSAVQLYHEDSLSATWNFEYAIADPARRVSGQRTLDPSQFSPDPVKLRERMRALKLGAIKLSPMLPDSFLALLGGSVQFLSNHGECSEALVLLGRDLEQLPPRAVHIRSGESLLASVASFPQVETPGNFIFEADPAAIRAHCLPALAEAHQLQLLGDSNGYLTGDVLASTPFLTCFEVIAVSKLDAGALLNELRRHGLKAESIKPRGVQIEPAEWVKRLQKAEGHPASVLVFSTQVGVRCAICRRRP